MCVLLEKFTPDRVLQKILIGIRNMFIFLVSVLKTNYKKWGVELS